jgi:hypothetical protein
MTLIEVVCGLALLATVLVSILLTRARAVRQSAIAQARVDAVHVADDLLARWWADPASFPRTAGGGVEGRPTLAWRTSPVANPPARLMGGDVVRLEILDRSIEGSREPVLAVEVVVPSPEEVR